MKFSAVFATLSLAVGSADAFVQPISQTAPPATSPLDIDVMTSTSLPASPPDTATKDIPYGETSRQFRRTVYSHDDWVKHRSPNRFVGNIFSIGSSGIYKVCVQVISCSRRHAYELFTLRVLSMSFDGFVS